MTRGLDCTDFELRVFKTVEFKINSIFELILIKNGIVFVVLLYTIINNITTTM